MQSRAAKPLPVLWSIVVDVGASGDNPVGVYGRMASVVVLPDVLHVDSAADARDLVDVLGVVEQVWVFSQELLVAFEVNGIDLCVINRSGQVYVQGTLSSKKCISS